MKKQPLQPALVIAIVLLGYCNLLPAQTRDQELEAVILHQDSLFWQAYNSCDTTAISSFFTKDVEFYHDKGGITTGVTDLVASIRKNLCSSISYRLRREAIRGSYRVFPLKNGLNIYGAILSGEHVFYILEPGKPEKLDGRAKFTHLWLLQNGVWQMKRLLSYDHGPASRR